MYIAEGNEIFYCNPDENGLRELFVTIHPTTSSKTPEQQAKEITHLFNHLLDVAAVAIAIHDD